jgi:hypothetical protein
MERVAVATRETNEEWDEFFDRAGYPKGWGIAFLTYRDENTPPTYAPTELGEWENRHLYALLLDEARATKPEMAHG